MNSNQKNTNDTVHVDEALQRLGERAPSRETIDKAIREGEIDAIAVNDGSEEISLVSMSSIEAFVANGGSGMAGGGGSHAAEGQGEDKPVATSASAGESAVNDGADPTVKDEKVEKIEPVSEPPGGIASPAAQLERRRNSDSFGHSISAQREKPAARAKPKRSKLRRLKDRLRGLDIDELKRLRDWADDRMFRMLGSMDGTSAGSENSEGLSAGSNGSENSGS